MKLFLTLIALFYSVSAPADNKSPDAARGWIELLKDEPVIIAVGVVSGVIGFVLCYYLVRKGYVSTPTMTKKMNDLHSELDAVRIENAELKKEVQHMSEGYEKYHELLNSFLASRKLDLMDKMAMEHGEKKG